MGVIDDILSILLASKKGNELPLSLTIDGTDWVLFWNNGTNRLERIAKDNFNSVATAIEPLYLGTVPTAGTDTTDTEIIDFINAQGFEVEANEIVIFELTIYIDSVAYTTRYFFKSNEVGTYGDAAANTITLSDIYRLSIDIFNVATQDTQVIDLGNIGSSTIEDYINALSGTLYSLAIGTIYQFTCVIDAVDTDYLYVGPLPNSIGDGGNAVTADDFYELSEVGAVTAADVSYSPVGNEVLTASDVQAALQEVDAALLASRATGLRYGGGGSDQGAGVFRIAAGAGTVLDVSTPSAPDYTSVTWAQTDLDLSASDDVYYISVDSAGTVAASTVEPSHTDYRQKIWLWRVSIRAGVVSGTTPIVNPTQQTAAQVWDIFRALGFIKSGLVLDAAATDLSIKHSAGTVYIAGSNFYTDPENPHEVDVALANPITFRHVLRDGTQGSDVTQLDVGNYDLAGVLTAIPGSTSRATIFTCKLFPGSSNYRFFYGQEYYNTVDEALAALQDGTHMPVLPEAYDNAITLGWIIAAKGATDLSDGQQIFVTSNKFGLTGGALASAGEGSLLAINNLADLDDVPTAQQNLDLEPGVDVEAYLGTVAAGNISGAVALNYNNKFWALQTMTADTTFSDTGLKVDGVTRDLYITGDWAPTFPAYWNADQDSQTYDGTKIFRLTWDVLNASGGSEDVRYFLKQITA